MVVGRCLNSNEEEIPLPIIIVKFCLNLSGWSVAGHGGGGMGEEFAGWSPLCWLYFGGVGFGRVAKKVRK